MRSVEACVTPLVSGVTAQLARGAAPETAARRIVDGKVIDQAVAYTLLVAALVVTYLVH